MNKPSVTSTTIHMLQGNGYPSECTLHGNGRGLHGNYYPYTPKR